MEKKIMMWQGQRQQHQDKAPTKGWNLCDAACWPYENILTASGEWR